MSKLGQKCCYVSTVREMRQTTLNIEVCIEAHRLIPPGSLAPESRPFVGYTAFYISILKSIKIVEKV